MQEIDHIMISNNLSISLDLHIEVRLKFPNPLRNVLIDNLIARGLMAGVLADIAVFVFDCLE